MKWVRGTKKFLGSKLWNLKKLLGEHFLSASSLIECLKGTGGGLGVEERVAAARIPWDGEVTAEAETVAVRAMARDPARVSVTAPADGRRLVGRMCAAVAFIRGLGVNIEIPFLSERGARPRLTRWPECGPYSPVE